MIFSSRLNYLYNKEFLQMYSIYDLWNFIAKHVRNLKSY